MPLECPVFTQDYNSYYSRYNACLDCRYRRENECWYHIPRAHKLADILTVNERLAILEDKQEVPEVNIVTITKQDYQQLQRLLLSLHEKLNSHIDKSKTKTRDKI